MIIPFNPIIGFVPYILTYSLIGFITNFMHIKIKEIYDFTHRRREDEEEDDDDEDEEDREEDGTEMRRMERML